MSEGIIQKVLKDFIDTHSFGQFGISESDINIELQQKLINEIDNWINSTDRNNVREALLGDIK